VRSLAAITESLRAAVLAQQAASVRAWPPALLAQAVGRALPRVRGLVSLQALGLVSPQALPGQDLASLQDQAGLQEPA